MAGSLSTFMALEASDIGVMILPLWESISAGTAKGIMPVSTYGQIALTLIPRGPLSLAADFVRPAMPCLLLT